MKRKVVMFLTYLFIGIGLASAQVRTVKGNVTSAEDGLPVVGASVVVDGTIVGTVTNIDVNTLIIAILTMIIQTSIVVLAGYAYSRYNFLARKQSLVFFLIYSHGATPCCPTSIF